MSKQETGFTLLEVAIAGAVLLGGMVLLAQMTNSTLKNTTPGFYGSTVGLVVDQQMRLHGSHFKSRRLSGINTSIVTRVGSESIYTVAGTRSYILPPAAGYLGTYAVTEQEITAKMTVKSNVVDSSDPLVGFTRLWKLDVYGTERAGL